MYIVQQVKQLIQKIFTFAIVEIKRSKAKWLETLQASAACMQYQQT